MTEQPPAVEPAKPCSGFPDNCPNVVDVHPDPPHHGGGIRCGCDVRAELEGMAFTLATGVGGIVDPRTFKATLDRYAAQAITEHTARQQQPERTPCSDPPCGYDGQGSLCDTHGTEQAHASGDHQWCGITCEVEFTSEKLRNGILWRAAPGSSTMLDELLRRAREED